MSSPRIAVCLAVAARRTVASALDWPGWCRAGCSPKRRIQELRAPNRGRGWRLVGWLTGEYERTATARSPATAALQRGVGESTP